MSHPHRLAAETYQGAFRCFLTICCHRRARHFTDPALVQLVTQQLLRTAHDYGVAIHAYCVMPDHLHLVCESGGDADVLRFVHMFKQRSGHDLTGMGRGRLWQKSYFDRHLCAEDDLRRVARYVLANPVRAGLVARLEDYPYSGSATMSLGSILNSI